MSTNVIDNNVSERAPVEAGVIKLGMDVHARQITVCAQEEGMVAKPMGQFTSLALLRWVEEKIQAGAKVYSCYEAGPCGYGLHRALLKLGAVNVVIVPPRPDNARRQKTDRLDAMALTDRLDRYVRGNSRVFSVVRVPTEEQEQLRAQARQRDQLSRMRRQAEARGRSLLLLQGQEAKGRWWGPVRWPKLKASLPPWLSVQLEVWQQAAARLDQQEKQLRKILEASAPDDLPAGIGALSWVVLCREILDWYRFGNRRHVASYTGLCPGVHLSNGRGREGSINRCGNPRVRHVLCEMVWRLARYQPSYPPTQSLLKEPAIDPATGQRKRPLSARRRRKLAAAAARRLAIDLWRIATGQTSAAKLGLIVPKPK